MKKLIFGCCACAVIVIGSSAAAQGNGATPHPEKYAVIALVPDSGFGGATVSIWRFPSGEQRNVVLLKNSTATSGVLEHAMQILAKSRENDGQVPEHVRHTTLMDRSGESKDGATRALFARLQQSPSYAVTGTPRPVPSIRAKIKDRSDKD